MEKNNESGEIILSENNGDMLLNEISNLIEQSRRVIYAQANSTTVLLFWKIGLLINNDIFRKQTRRLRKKDCVGTGYAIKKKIWKQF